MLFKLLLSNNLISVDIKENKFIISFTTSGYAYVDNKNNKVFNKLLFTKYLINLLFSSLFSSFLLLLVFLDKLALKIFFIINFIKHGLLLIRRNCKTFRYISSL